MAAPEGNNNAGKGKEWKDALRYALANYEDNQVQRGTALKAIAKKIVIKALEGEYPAIQEIGNRIDGKPVQAIEGTGDNGEIPLSVAVKFINSVND